MICRCFGLRFDPGAVLDRAGAVARTVAGAPDYAAYVAHIRAAHPEREVPTREAFFRARAAGRFRCC